MHILYSFTILLTTCSYIAPEYAQTGKLTIRSDVFSFGVMLLELITGRRPIAKDKGLFCKEDNIVDWVSFSFLEGTLPYSYFFDKCDLVVSFFMSK